MTNASTIAPPGPQRSLAARLLAWYDRNARTLPWRAPPGSPPPDPYRVWLSEIMLQQTTVATVTPRFGRFLALWPTVEALAGAPLGDVLGEWAGLGYYARARNLHACARAVADAGGRFPDTEEELRALPGIGPYTAAAIAAFAFGRHAVIVDGNVERVMVRVGNIRRPIRDARPEIRDLAERYTPEERSGDFAQGLMDLGAGICRPRTPLCGECPIAADCEALAAGRAAELPVRPPRKARPVRHGTVYVGLRADGAVLTERRPEKGLFGGMAGLPGGEWREGMAPAATPPVAADWRKVGEIGHTLTHFSLTLTVMVGTVDTAPEGLGWTAPAERDRLPTVFRKALALADGVSSGRGGSRS